MILHKKARHRQLFHPHSHLDIQDIEGK